MFPDTNVPNKLSIIIIEDNPGDYVLIEDFLYEKFKNLKVKQFTRFKEFASYFEKNSDRNDLILLDLHLADANGLALIQNMLDLSSKVPIIILTGYSDLPLAKKSLELGISDFLVKDEIDPNLLHKSIEFAISRRNYILQIENQNKKLKSIAWTQSHEVRAPLARILGIINMIDTLDKDISDLPFWLTQLKVSSQEMDEIVQSIVKKTQILKIEELK